MTGISRNSFSCLPEGAFFTEGPSKDRQVGRQFELYNLQQNPEEMQTLAQDPAYQKLLEELKGWLKSLQEPTLDRWVMKWGHE
jgi:N-sulfoglucosamine sulfohydrolase